MDKETRELLENIQNQILTLSKETNNRFDKLEIGQNETNTRLEKVENRLNGVENRLNGVEERLNGVEDSLDTINDRLDKLEIGQNEIKTLLEELEPKNANRHLELKNSIDELRDDLSTVEIVTANNYKDIAMLKRIK
ncbi:MAG: hypothetical protein RIN55_07955 [Tissierellaceae bacterium]|nr:hypothetical protein [Tissierellaceae bacterium]